MAHRNTSARLPLGRRQFLHLAGGLSSLFGLSLAGCKTDPPPLLTPDPDAGKPWWLRGNFAPTVESEGFALEVVGALPPSLNGLYVRNGPNPPSGESGHWFLGDGFVHGVRIEAGKAPWYRGRYIETEVLGAPPNDNIGPPGLTEHQANTSIIQHAGRLLCLEEIGLPYEISAADLSTIGPYDYAGALTTAMTAHPKIDPSTGEMVFFGYGALPPFLTYHVVNAEGQLVKSEEIEVPAAVMMHDFQVTESHVIFMYLPIVFDLSLALEGVPFPFRWDPTNGSRLGVMPRGGGNADVQWFDIDTCYVFHTFNAYHDPNDANRIVLDAVRYPEIWVESNNDFDNPGEPYRWIIDLGKNGQSGSVSGAPHSDQRIEFPHIDPRRQGLVHRYGYGITVVDENPDGDTEDFSGSLVKFDFTGGSTQSITLPDDLRLGEALFVPDSPSSGEDEGWLLAYAHDKASNKSQLVVLDAHSFSPEPVARILLPSRVPYGFHGTWALAV